MKRPLLVALLATGLAVLMSCNPVEPSVGAPEQDAAREQLTSVVQLGDSVASGEGTLYGYEWDAAGQDWTGGNIDAPWPEPYPDCHTSQYAYGSVVASYFGATFHQYACTGATFANGITTAETGIFSEYRPAQFGNWDAQTELNADYDTAAPQLVLITLGADDLKFVSIVEHCIENGYEKSWHLADLECIDGNPGSTIQTDYIDFLPTLEQNYGTLVRWIKERASANGVPEPKIVVTNYPNPLPPDGAVCNDTNYLEAEQIQYLSELVDELNSKIEETISALNDPAVAVADISGAYTVQGTSHIWCSDDPRVYGLSIYSVSSPTSFESQAPFHPTPDGQESIAEHVIPVVRQWFAKSSPANDETPPTSEPAPTTAPEPTTTG